MSTAVAPGRLYRDIPLLEASPADERWVRRRVTLAWGLLVVNVLTYYPATWSGAPLAIHIPSPIGKLVTQGALPMAMVVALTVNRRLLIRPNAYLCIVSLLALAALIVMLEPGHFGTIYRTFRMIGFVATLWMLTPWWGRRDMLLVRSHLVAMSVVLGTVLLGILVAPKTALAQGRLEGSLWPYPPTQVAHFAAVLVGIMVLLWLCSLVSGRLALLAVAAGIPVLLLTHTRTALVAMLAGILIGGMSLFRARARVRKLFAALCVIVSIGAITLSGFLTTWLSRGESTQQLTSLTGRTTVWTRPAQRSPQRVRGYLRLRIVEPFVQRTVDRQQLARGLPRPGPCRRSPYCGDAAVRADQRLLPATRPAARRCPVPGDVLPDLLLH